MSAAPDLPQRPSSGPVLRSWIRALENVNGLAGRPDATLPALVGERARTHGGDVALLGPSEALTCAALAQRARAVSLWALREGLAQGDVVGLLMPNAPDYVATWLGLTGVGCVAALLDTNLLGDGLAHAIRVAGARRVIATEELRGRLGPAVRCHDPAECRRDTGDIPPERLAVASDVALLIGTSGTTGLPKAARITHARIMEWSGWFAGMTGATQADRLYDCLPLYHSVGGVVAVGSMLFAGGSVAIAERFSARRFWDDVAERECTIFQYIGELCRYLVSSPPHPRERAHRLRLACGNGMQADTWTELQRRFAIAEVLEFYAATEGSLSLFNREGKPGAIGRVPPFLAHRFPVALVRIDPDTSEPLRGPDGLCLRCGPDEAGEALGPPRFDGYTDAAATERKMLRDVLAQGDLWFRTGDLMRRDAGGFYYFIDRIGDTFRWKGENVSTTQVAEAIATCPGVLDAVVFGVRVAGAEGRAGMAAVAVDAGFSPAALHAHLCARLPAYARPLYLRLCDRLETTGTFKLKKSALAEAGIEADGVLVDDGRDGFVPLRPAGRPHPNPLERDRPPA